LNARHSPARLIACVHALLRSLRRPELQPFLAAWPGGAAAPSAPYSQSTPTATAMASMMAAGGADSPPPLPVLQWLPQIANQAPDFATPLLGALGEIASSLTWRQTYSRAQVGDEFLRGYGYTEVVGPRSPVHSSRIACGLLLLAPSVLYPRHRHEAEEIYVILSGEGRWLQGDETWRRRPPGDVIHHASEEFHAMQTTSEPMLALYLWRSNDLNQKARLDGDESSAGHTVPC
jgi:quercetin dioxygenase-like cupin family protein